MRQLLEGLCEGENLSREATAALFSRVVAGELSEIEMAALLIALKAKGETPEEIAGAASALRTAARPFPLQGMAVADSCGTGGDGAGTVNISTAVAVLAAEMGIAMVKHGNRSVSSKCGSADVLERCGVRIEASPDVSRQCLQQQGICFLFAPQYHAGMRHAMPVRRGLGTRTIFNVLGPLSNPANPKWQIVGVYDPRLCQPLARTLGLLGCEGALVVHGSGLDEIAIHGPTEAMLLKGGEVRAIQITPDEVGLQPRSLDELRGGDAEANAAWLKQLLAGKGVDAHDEAVAINAGALAWVAGRASSLDQGYALAREALAGGGAAERLQRWAELSRSGT